ncbi:MAG: DNA polymerase III subunit gamma/tau C-terminal domain-containing protein, partial [Burkholderiaceae bacterium]
SRCLQFNLRPMAPQTVQAHLADVLAQEGIEAEPAALRLLARAARGSLRDGLSLTDQAIAFGAGRVAEAQVRQMLGSVDRSHAVRLVQALAGRDGAAVIAAVDGLRTLGLSAAATLEEMAALLQQMAVLQAVPDALDATDPEAAGVANLAAGLAADETQLLYSIVLHGRAEISLAPDEYSGLVMVLLRWLAFAPNGADSAVTAPTRRAAPTSAAASSPATSAAPRSPSAVPVRPSPTAPPAVESPARPPAAASAARALAQPAAVAAPATLRVDLRSNEPPPWLDIDEDDPGAPPPVRPAAVVSTLRPAEPAPADREPTPAERALGDRWADVVAQLIAGGGVTALVRELAWQAQCLAIDAATAPQRWQLRVEREMLRAPAHADKLQAALTDLLGMPVRIEVLPGPARDTPAERDAAERARRQAAAEQAIQADPLVQSLMAQYTTARIVPGSIKPN